MSMVSNYRKFMGEQNEEKFNEDLLNAKKNDDIIKHMDCICKALTVIPGIEYLGSEYKVNKEIYRKTSTKKEIDSEDSYLDSIIIRFKLKAEGEEKLIEKNILFPRLMEGQYFIINGNRFVPIFQMVDAGTYRNKDALTLKTLLMPIKISASKSKIEDVYGTEYSGNTYKLDIFKNKINIYEYLFSKFGVEEAIEFMEIKGILEDPGNEYEDKTEFRINNNVSLYVEDSYLEDNNQNNIDMIVTLIDVFGKRSKVEDQKYWIKKLGSHFIQNTARQEEKALGILLSLERILDETTKTILRTDDENKKDVYHIIKWMCNNFTLLSKQDTLNLDNKRLRLYEYILNPLLIRFSKSTYRLLNSRKTTISSLETVFSNIQKGTLVKEIVKHELVRYKNSVNSYDLFTMFLKQTNSGKMCASV